MHRGTIPLPANYRAKMQRVMDTGCMGVVLRQFPDIGKSTWHNVRNSGRVSRRTLHELNGFFAEYGAPKDRLDPLDFDSLASELQVPATFSELSEPPSLPISPQYPQNVSPQLRFDAAVAELNSERVGDALGALQWTYRELLKTRLEEALARLPRVLYAAFRHGTYRDLTRIAVETTHAMELAPKHLTMPEKTRTAALAVLACCLNEGGKYPQAGDFFNSIRGKLAKPEDPEFGWTVGTSYRSETHLFLWHQRSPNQIDRCLREARAADAILGTKTSIIHTQCDVYLEHQPTRAWDTIKPEFRRVIAQIVENYDSGTGLLKPGKTPLARLHHEVGSVILGLFAAGQVDGALGRDEIQQGLGIFRSLGFGRMSHRKAPEWSKSLHGDHKKRLIEMYKATRSLETPILWVPQLTKLASSLPR